MTTETGSGRHVSRKGLTLVEAMLAVVVLAIAAAGVLFAVCQRGDCSG